MTTSKSDKLLKLAHEIGILRARDLDQYGIQREYLSRLVRQERLIRIGRGLYVLADGNVTTNQTIAETCKRIPEGVICLLSALSLHGLTTQMPYEVWLAIGFKARLPKEPNLPVRIVRFSGQALTEGIEERRIEGVKVKVYNPAKTVADCFKYRNKIGLDVALEALKDCRAQGKCPADELWRYAKICRQTRVMRPYIEALQ